MLQTDQDLRELMALGAVEAAVDPENYPVVVRGLGYCFDRWGLMVA